MNKTTILMFVTIAAFAVVGAAAISVAPAEAQPFQSNNQQNDQRACQVACNNQQVANNQQNSDFDFTG
jgi:hypothetical protein